MYVCLRIVYIFLYSLFVLCDVAVVSSQPVLLLLLLLDLLHAALVLLLVARMLGNGVIVAVVDDAQLAEHVAPDRGLDRPVVAVVALALPIEALHVEDLGAEPLEDDADVLDAQMLLLVDAELVDEQQELLRRDRLVLHHRVLGLALGALVVDLRVPAVALDIEEAHVSRLGLRRSLLLGVLNGGRGDALVDRDFAALLVQGATVKIALDRAIALGAARPGLVSVMRALWRVNMYGGALDRAALLGQAMRGLNVVMVYHSDLGTGIAGLWRCWIRVIYKRLLLTDRRLDNQRRPFTG